MAMAASIPVEQIREIIPTMLVRCLQIPPLLTAKTNVHLMSTTYTAIRLTGEATRRMMRLRDYLDRT